MSRAALVVGCALALLSACSGHHDAGPAPRPDQTNTTAAIDRSGIALAVVPGQTTTTIIETGTASLVGLVKGPDGFVVGATVRIERLVAGREIRTDVVTGPDGGYLLANVPGGRYRVRAFLAPTLAQTTPEVQFLTDGEKHTIDLAVTQQSGLVVRADVAPDLPLLGHAVNLVASVLQRTVGADGVVRSTPVVGSTVELIGLGRWRLRDASSSDGSTTTTTSTTIGPPTSSTSSSSTTSTTVARERPQSPTSRTDGSGQVRYELRCDAPGAPGLSLRVAVTVTPPPDSSGAQGEPYVSDETLALDLPDCIDPATTTTTTTTEPPTTTAKP